MAEGATAAHDGSHIRRSFERQEGGPEMIHPLTLQTLASSHRADLLADADRHRLARTATRRAGRTGASQAPLVRLRHGLATTLAATLLALTLVIV